MPPLDRHVAADNFSMIKTIHFAVLWETGATNNCLPIKAEAGNEQNARAEADAYNALANPPNKYKAVKVTVEEI